MTANSTVPGSAKPKAKPRGGSRKGIPNKVTAELKDMILAALDGAGGVKYLQTQALDSPAAFMALVGRVLPLTVKGAGDEGEHKFVVTWQK